MKPAAILDVGSSKIVCAIGDFSGSDGITIYGTAVCPYAGYEDGEFLDHKSLHNAVVDAIQQAEQEARIRIREVAIAVPCPFTKLLIRESSVPIGERGRRIQPEDVDLAMSASLEGTDEAGYILMHSTPVSFSANGKVTPGAPVGVRAPELHMVASHMFVREDFVRAFESVLSAVEIEISMCVSEILCSALAVIPEKERIRPAVLIDFGYSHTDIATIENGAITGFRTIPIGGRHFASDLSFGLDVPLEAAEIVKRRYVFMQKPLSNTEIIRTGSETKRVDRKVIDLIVNARAGELMTLLREAMKELSIVPDANPVTYVTGGGMVMMKGALEYLQVNLQLNAKKDEPWAEDMNTPNFTSTFAVLDFVIRASGEEFVKEDNQEGSVFSRIRDLFK